MNAHSRIVLEAQQLEIGYDQRIISSGLNISIPQGSFTVIIGPNASGKSTLLRALSRLLAPRHGNVLLEGQNIAGLKTKEIARRLGLLPQSSIAPDGIRVIDLVGRGRFPHQSFLERWSRADEEAVQFAMRATSIEDLSFRLVDQLSGGQRQRVWIAMVLAQQTPLLLLDEPTTFLDITYQYDVLELCRDLNEQHERTVVAVLHDLNQAARFATNLVVMHEGQVRAEGDPREVLTRETVREVYGLDCQVIPDPVSGAPLVIPLERGRSVRSAV